MSWPEQRVEQEARDICRESAEFMEALAFWLIVGWALFAVSLIVNIYLLVTR